MNCKFCNADLNEDALFCSGCGAKVGENPQEDTPRYCQCGAELTPDAKFCSRCATSVTDNKTVNQTDVD